MPKNDLAIFEDHKIRRIYDKNSKRYWSDLKNPFQ